MSCQLRSIEVYTSWLIRITTYGAIGRNMALKKQEQTL